MSNTHIGAHPMIPRFIRLFSVPILLGWLALVVIVNVVAPQLEKVGEAHAVSWMSFIAATIHPARRIGVERWKEVFGIAEQRLGGREWTVERYSIADIHLFRLYWRFVGSVKPAPGDFPSLSAHYERMMVRPAVRRTIEIERAIGYALPQ